MNDELSPRERADMKDLVLAGAQRISPAGRHRRQIIAGAVSLVLIAGVTGTALVTANLFGSDAQPAPSPTVTETATPTPTPTPTALPAGTLPFGGECANVLTDEEVEALRGVEMLRSDYRWRTGANDVLGAIDCVWVSPEEYLATRVHVYAYPESVVPQSVLDANPEGCVKLQSNPSIVTCSAVGVVAGTWLLVQATAVPTAASPDQITLDGVAALYASAAARLADSPSGGPIASGPDWWQAPDCTQLSSQVDAAAYGYERVAPLEPQQTTSADAGWPGGIPAQAGAAWTCDLHFTAGAGDTSRGEVVTVSIVPGGAIAFDTALAAEHAQTVDVGGAQAAVWVPGLDRYEGSPEVLVVSDGVNILMVSSQDWRAEPGTLVPLAETLLPLMHP